MITREYLLEKARSIINIQIRWMEKCMYSRNGCAAHLNVNDVRWINRNPGTRYAWRCVEGASQSQQYMSNLYKGGMTASMALQYSGEIDESRIKLLQKKYDKYLSGPKNAGKIVPVPAGMQLQPLNYKLTDAQFFELKKYTALQIAGAFGVKPNQDQ